ncbi:MAG: DUF305 domain-containing protein [Chloroflexota bacterium]|nr:DUF305 domain-containing protein [Chloroflexota bacterium]
MNGAANQVPASPPRPRRQPWFWIVGGIVVAAAVVIAILSGSRTTVTPAEDSAEAGFARDMITHHEQAVEMALLVRDRTGEPLVRSFATDIILTQTNQMGQMMGWLDVWGLPLTGLDRPMTWMGHGGLPMPGLASSAELAELSNLAGAEAEVLFLQLMSRHHLGGIPMAQAILEQSEHPVTSRLATSIINAQRNEVDIMAEMLAERGAEPLE